MFPFSVDGLTSDMFSVDLGKEIPRDFTSILEHTPERNREQRNPSPFTLQDTFELPARVEAPDFLSGDSASVREQVSRNEVAEASTLGDTTPEDLFRLFSPLHAGAVTASQPQELLNCTIDHDDIPFSTTGITNGLDQKKQTKRKSGPRMDLYDHDGRPMV